MYEKMNLATWDENEMAGLKEKSGPPGNMNAFKHGLAAIQEAPRREHHHRHEEKVRQQNPSGIYSHMRLDRAFCQ